MPANRHFHPIHPLTFKPEFINAYELGTKNTLLDGALTFNGSVFFYDYTGYQISRIVDRTAINDNFDAKVKGAEIEATYEPLPGLRFKFAGGYEHTRIDNGQSSIDLMDRADVANHPDWMVVKPFVTQASNCILPVYVVAAILKVRPPIGTAFGPDSIPGACANAYQRDVDPGTLRPYKANPVYPSDYNDIVDVPGLSKIRVLILVSIHQPHRTTGRDLPKIWAATNCPMRHHSQCHCPAIIPFL